LGGWAEALPLVVAGAVWALELLDEETAGAASAAAVILDGEGKGSCDVQPVCPAMTFQRAVSRGVTTYTRIWLLGRLVATVKLAMLGERAPTVNKERAQTRTHCRWS